MASPLEKLPSEAEIETSRKSHSEFKTRYPSVARYRTSQHLDPDPRQRDVVIENRHIFENFLTTLSDIAEKNGVPQNSPEMEVVVKHLGIMKDEFGRALLHAFSKVDGVPFEKAVEDRTK